MSHAGRELADRGHLFGLQQLLLRIFDAAQQLRQFGLFAGFMTGATFVATALGVTFLFEGRPLSLWLIDAGYQTLNFTVMGAILGGWH